MYDVGDTAVLSNETRDATGALVNVTGMTLTITLPDGTTSTPSVTNPSTGEYSAQFAITQAGRHVADWAATGYADSTVLQVWAADPRMLFSLDDAKGFIGNVDSADNEDIRLMVAAVTPVIEDIVGPLTQSSVTRTFNGGNTRILLPPNVTVTSVIENGITLTVGSDCTHDQARGILYGGGTMTPRVFWWGIQNIAVTYTQGSGVISPNVLLAAVEEFRFLWQIGQQGGRPAYGQAQDDTAFTPSGYAVPRRVIELCAGQRRTPVFA